MSKENRAIFERALLGEIKQITCAGLALSASKNALKFRLNKQLVAELDFQHLAKSGAYVLLGRVIGGPIFECASRIRPPYRSNLASDACFSFTTSGRQDKKFSQNVYGSIDMPKPDAALAVSKHIRRALEDYYVPMIAGCIIPSDRTIEDVLYEPTDYAYPAVFVHCAITCDPSILKPGVMARLKTRKRMIKNKTFDLELLDRACAVGMPDAASS
jgi:hypothetical protein